MSEKDCLKKNLHLRERICRLDQKKVHRCGHVDLEKVRADFFFANDAIFVFVENRFNDWMNRH